MIFDENLVALAGKGDKTAFNDLYTSIYPDLYKYAFYTLNDRETALDAVSDTMLDIWKGLPRLQTPGAFGAWAFRILSLRCKNLIKNLIEARNTVDIDELVKTPSNDSAPIDESISENTALYDALMTLSEEDRQIIVLSVIHGYSNKEISESLEIPAGTVSSKLARGYEKLRKKLGGENYA